MQLTLYIPANGQQELEHVLEFMTQVAERQCRALKLPHPYVAGIKYEREPAGREDWFTPTQIIARGKDDCEGLAYYLAGWLRAHGQRDARAVLKRSSVGYHAIVQTNRATIDPSRALGMGRA